MQLTVAFTDSGFPDFSFTATEKSLVKDAAEAAAEEWGTDAEFMELSFAGEVLPSANLLVGQCGVVSDSTLEASLVRCIGRKLLMHALENIEKGRNTLLWLIQGTGDQTLRLDTPTFVDEDGLLAFDSKWIPEGVSSICFAEPDPSVTSVARYFLMNSTTLTSVDLMGLQHVTTVGSDFLRGCNSLTTIDLSPLQNIECFGCSFVAECTSLKTISNMSSLSKVTKTGEDFLWTCRFLEFVDLSCFANVTDVGEGFMCQCFSLKTISNMSSLSNVTTIGEFFLSGCSFLKSVDASPLVNVTDIGKCFLYNCTSLRTISGMSALSNVTSIGGSFLEKCLSLESVDMSCFMGVTDVGSYMLAECSSLKTISNMSALSNATSIGEFFLLECSSLESVDMFALQNVTLIHDGFLEKCYSLKNISNISGLRNVKHVSERFLLGCRSLTPIDTSVPGWKDLSGELRKVFEKMAERERR